MNSRQRKIKKAIIISLTLFIVIISYQLLFPKIPELCFNGVLDIGEKKVDCGGICVKKCPISVTPPSIDKVRVGWIKYIKDGKNNYDLVANIINDNSLWGVSSVDYEFIIHSDENKIIKTTKKKTYIMPKGFLKENGTKYIIEDNFKTDFNIKKVNIRLSDYIWKKVKDSRDILNFNTNIISIKDKKSGYIKDGSGFYYVYGVTKNNSKYSFYKVDINVIIYDKNDEPIAVGTTNQLTMSADGGWGFKIFWNKPFVGDISHIDYEAQTNVFDASNFMNDFGTGDKYIAPR